MQRIRTASRVATALADLLLAAAAVAAPCPQNAACPFPDGVCCPGTGVCCPASYRCLDTDPPRCASEPQVESFNGDMVSSGDELLAISEVASGETKGATAGLGQFLKEVPEIFANSSAIRLSPVRKMIRKFLDRQCDQADAVGCTPADDAMRSVELLEDHATPSM